MIHTSVPTADMHLNSPPETQNWRAYTYVAPSPCRETRRLDVRQRPGCISERQPRSRLA